MRCKLVIKLALIGSASAFSITAAEAQVAPVDSPTAANPTGQSSSANAEPAPGDIVVTARGRGESLQKLPDAVTAISGAQIEQQGVQNVQDLTRLAPNFDFRTGFRAGAAQITVRGLTTPQGGELPIALVIDGVELPGADFFNQDLLDVSQVEVLRGPQGALYGQGAVAGAMLITTRAPTNNFEFNGRASYGSADTYHLVGSLSGPIVKDALYFRIVGAYRNSDGTIKDVNGKGRNFVDEPFVRGELRYDTGGSFRATLAGNYDRSHNGGIYQDRAPTRPDGTIDIDNANVNIISNIIGKEQRQIYGASLRMEQDIAGGVLSSTSSYDRLKSTTFGDADFTAANVLSQTNVYNIKLFNEDLRYTSASNQPFRYVFGGFFQTRTIDEALSVPFLPGSGRGGFAAVSADRRESKTYAVFAQVNYNVTDKLELTGALRYDSNDRNFHNLYTDARLSNNFSKVQPKVSIAYNWTNNFMTYFTFAVGFRSGDFNAASSVFAGPVIQSETSRNYEVGTKIRFLDGKGSITAALYRIDLDNGQFYFTSQTPPSQNTININSSQINGGEIELQLEPVRHLNLQGSIGVSHAEINSFNGTGLNDHTPFPTVPSYTARGSASYDIALGSDYTLTPLFDVYNRGREYFLPGSQLRSGSYTDEDVRLTLATKRWSVAGFVANISNERHAEVASSALRTISVPRTYGVEVALHF